jgi:hypothetical protein
MSIQFTIPRVAADTVDFLELRRQAKQRTWAHQLRSSDRCSARSRNRLSAIIMLLTAHADASPCRLSRFAQACRNAQGVFQSLLEDRPFRAPSRSSDLSLVPPASVACWARHPTPY